MLSREYRKELLRKYARSPEDDALLATKPVNMLRRTFPGGPDWRVWRRCIHDFLPMLFK